MVWTQVQDEIEVTDYRPARHTRVKKMIWSDSAGSFETRYFIRILCDNPAQCADTRDWLTEQFGPSQYQGTWWQDGINHRQLWLSESLATFWQLRWGNQE